MKSEKGIATVSVIIYVLAMTIVVGTIGLLTTVFYNNITLLERKADNATEYNKLNSCLIADMKTPGVKIRKIEEGNNPSIELENGTKYTFKEGSIYREKVKICTNVEQIHFSKSIEFEKTILKVEVVFGTENNTFSKTMEYTLEP